MVEVKRNANAVPKLSFVVHQVLSFEQVKGRRGGGGGAVQEKSTEEPTQMTGLEDLTYTARSPDSGKC
jgi:hypothetical protein